MAQPRWSKERIINQARSYARLAPVNSGAIMEQAEIQYDLLKSSMLQERPWPFTVAISNGLEETDQGENLGYSRKYRLPTDAVADNSVIALNPNARYVGSYSTSNTDRLRLGLAPIDDDPLQTIDQNRDYFVKKGVLHTNVVVTDILYQREPTEQEFTIDFTAALAWSLAQHYAMTEKLNPQLAAYCAQQASFYHAKAYKGLTRQFPSVESRIFRNWIQVFFGSLYF